MGLKNVVVYNLLVTIKKIAELENKKVIAVAEIHLKRIDRLYHFGKSIRKHPDWVLEIYGKDTTYE
jgi:hypothetical protein